MKLILAGGIAWSMATVSMAADWGILMFARPNTVIRETRSANSPVKGSLAAGQVVKVDFLKDDWYAVFALEESRRSESKALGYVNRSRLYLRRPPSPQTPPDGEKPSANSMTTSAREAIPDIEVKHIGFKREDGGKEMISIEFNRFYTPAISAVEGKAPRIILDIAGVSSLKKDWTRIHVGGEMIRQIRCSMNTRTRTARIVLDMEPSKDYHVQPVFREKGNTYLLEIVDKHK